MSLELIPISGMSLYDEDGVCSGTRYAVPKHVDMTSRVCDFSNRIVDESEFDKDEQNPNPIQATFHCPDCHTEFSASIKDGFL